jgi:hypothetical protein
VVLKDCVRLSVAARDINTGIDRSQCQLAIPASKPLAATESLSIQQNHVFLKLRESFRRCNGFRCMDR